MCVSSAYAVTVHLLLTPSNFVPHQAPYFWPSNCWEPENTDYGKRLKHVVHRLCDLCVVFNIHVLHDLPIISGFDFILLGNLRDCKLFCC